MAGVGPPPKEPSKRARRNSDPVPQTVLKFVKGQQPELPPDYDWPQRTRDWWRMWAEAPQAENFTQTDWDSLLDTALIHAEMWSGNLAVAGELRLRVAAFGATPADRARLRITFAEADEKDAARPAGSTARDRYGNLRPAVGEATVTPIKQARARRPSRSSSSSTS